MPNLRRRAFVLSCSRAFVLVRVSPVADPYVVIGKWMIGKEALVGESSLFRNVGGTSGAESGLGSGGYLGRITRRGQPV